MIVSIFFDNNKKTKLFSDFSEPKFYIKKIKNKDDYLSYIVYSHLMYLIKDDYKINGILNELIQKFKYRVEAYLFYWQILYKGNFKNYNLANSLTENLIKITSLMKFDENNFNL